MEKMISEQEYIEATNQYRARIKLQSHEIAMVNAMLRETIKQANRAAFRYDNIKSLLNRYIATGLMPGYFDIYNDLQDTKRKLKDARKEAAAANKRYKQLKKEFARYRNEHTESDCNPYLAKIRDLEQQIEAMNAHGERFVIPKCEDCYWSFFYGERLCCSAYDDQECSSVDGACKGFKPKEENKHEGSKSTDTE